MNREIHYLNTDLEIEAPLDISPLSQDLSARGLLLLGTDQRDDGSRFAVFETAGIFRAPEPNIVALLTTIEGMNLESRQLWGACTRREFNIGYDRGDRPRSFNNELTATSLSRMAALRIALRITIYPPSHDKTGG